MSTFIEIDEEWTVAQATRKYSSHKSWHTRYLKKVQGLNTSVDKAFYRVMEESLNDNLTRYEGEVAILRQLADFMQQAHLLNCLDRELSLQLDSSIQATTPVMGNGVTCLSILTGIFEKKYPLLLCRKNFFSMAQQAGQDERSFAEAVKIAANESDIAGMTLQDAMCLVILTGCKDTRLKEKMSELETPTMAAFNILIDAHMHAKAMSAKPASSCGAQANKPKNTGREGQNSGV